MSRDHRKGTLQITYGLLCAPDGCPVAIEVFDGNTGDPTTLAPQIEKLKQRFHLDRGTRRPPSSCARLTARTADSVNGAPTVTPRSVPSRQHRVRSHSRSLYQAVIANLQAVPHALCLAYDFVQIVW